MSTYQGLGITRYHTTTKIQLDSHMSGPSVGITRHARSRSHARIHQLDSHSGLSLDVNLVTSVDGTPRRLQAIDMPRIIPPGKPSDDWLLWFHGRDWNMPDDIAKESTGRIFFATSRDGLCDWRMHEDSPIMGPHKEDGDWFYFDSEHVGLGDVIKPGGLAQSKFATQDGVFLMYIFG